MLVSGAEALYAHAAPADDQRFQEKTGGGFGRGQGNRRGILAAMISGNLGKTKVPIFGADFSYEWKDNARADTVHFLPIPLQGKRVLVTVGEVHSGATLAAFVKKCREAGALEVRSASLYRSQSETFSPNYVGGILTKKTPMPWHLITGYEKPSFPQAA